MLPQLTSTRPSSVLHGITRKGRECRKEMHIVIVACRPALSVRRSPALALQLGIWPYRSYVDREKEGDVSCDDHSRAPLALAWTSAICTWKICCLEIVHAPLHSELWCLFRMVPAFFSV